ncbi:hypothetical protein EBZ70_11885 [bacterium]|nr:hypothetical protein [bacterium]
MLISRTVALVVEGQTRGDLAYFNGTEWVRIPIGTFGQVLSTDGDVPQWTTIAPGISGKYRFANTSPAGGPAVVLTVPHFFPFTGYKTVEVNAALKYTQTSGGAISHEDFYLRVLLTSTGEERPDTRVASIQKQGVNILAEDALTFSQSGTSLLMSMRFAAGGGVEYRVSFTEA